MANEERYIEERDGTYYIRGHRIPLRSLIRLWQDGTDPESIQRDFDSLTLTEVYGAITFYLEHREDLDVQFAQQWAEEQALVDRARANPSPFMQELQRRFAAIQAQHKAS
jgi:uncharacterized protein (DUF433 family)